MMTPEKLNEIKARAEVATPGPWEFTENEFNYEGDNGDHIGSIHSSEWWVAAIDDTGPEEGQSEANAIFIAHARTDIPALLQTIELLQAEIQMLVSACQNVLEDAKARPGAYLYADLTALRIAVEEDQ